MALDRPAPGTETPGEGGASLIVRPTDALVEPIVVPNTLWASTDPLAYDGGRPTDITHLHEVERAGLERRDDAR